MLNRYITLICLSISFLACVSCRHNKMPDTPPRAVVRDGVAITLRDQKLSVLRRGKVVKDYKISSSKFGMGSSMGSNRTPLGIHAVTKKIGEGQPAGMVFKGCRPTGEVVEADSGRDPIVTRVIQLAGLEPFNRNSHKRRIYIHGTPEERFIGRPASYGCIRMRSKDVLDLYPYVYRGMPVAIESCSQSTYMEAERAHVRSIVVPASVVAKLPTENTLRAANHPTRTHRGTTRATTRLVRTRVRDAATGRSLALRRSNYANSIQ